MSEPKLSPFPESLIKARAEADNLARLLHEDLPDGDEIKDALFAVGMAIKRALPVIRALEGKGQLQHTSPNEFLGVG